MMEFRTRGEVGSNRATMKETAGYPCQIKEDTPDSGFSRRLNAQIGH
jgi:hypothetical protein